MKQLKIRLDPVETNQGRQLWSRSEKKIWLGMMMAGTSMLYATRVVMPVSSVALSTEMKWDKTQSGTVLSAFFWGYTMTQCLGGYLSDRFGGELILAYAAFAYAGVTVSTPLLVHLFSGTQLVLTVTVLSRIFVGCAQGIHPPSLSSLLSQRLPPAERAFGFAFSSAGCSIGTILTGSIGSLILSAFGWPILFYFFGALGLMWALGLKYILFPTLENTTTPPSPSENSEAVPWRFLLKSTPVWALLVSHFCMNSAFFVLLSWMPTYFEESFPNAQRWVFNVVPWCVSIPVSVSGGRITDWLISTKGWSVTLARKSAHTFAFLGLAACLVAVGYVGSYQGALVFMSLGMALQSLHTSGILVNPQDIAPKYSGFVFGLMNTAGSVPGFLGTYVAGHILEASGSWPTVFNLAAAMLVAGWLIFLLFGTTNKIV